ncbi:PREDICTED: uncharacterized protein LOC104814050 isoform X2 [Tarenaya hassleriana]|uniref:uncharacterized protein LOC104814050 isoform X2 n=1 Tax=Tarenaya hassleriana TaxID=28532 RepID=UPI00053C4430|nr:PREDICTED: uncharacterized protein LOC104814050 isoform X2 [Tarenaya hassleriana]
MKMNSIHEVLFEAHESSLSDMTEQDGFHINLDEIDLSLLRLSSSPYSLREFLHHSPVSAAAVAMKSPSPDSDVSDQSKRRKILVQNQDLIDPCVFSGYPENPPSSEPTQNRTRIGDPSQLAPVVLRRSLFDGYLCPLAEKQETTFKCKPFPEKTMMEESPESKEMNGLCKDLDFRSEEHSHKELEDATKDLEEGFEEEGMRIERSGDGYVIRLKCQCRNAYRVLFSDSHFYFKLL